MKPKCKSWIMAYDIRWLKDPINEYDYDCETKCPHVYGEYIGNCFCSRSCNHFKSMARKKQYVECGFHLKEGE